MKGFSTVHKEAEVLSTLVSPGPGRSCVLFLLGGGMKGITLLLG